MPETNARSDAILERLALARLRATTEDIVDMAERVDSVGDVGWLAEPLWPADAYGVIAAKDKAGKTWFIVDLAVSVATGTPWLGRFACEQGPVIMYCGEGGARNIVRRVRAVAEHKGRPFRLLRGHLSVSEQAPRFKEAEALETMSVELGLHSPRLVIVDPLYLAAAGGKGSDLYAMGEVLSGVQQLCQEAGAALVVTHHWKKTGTETGADRMTGVGPGAWGRVLGSGNLTSTVKESNRSIVEVEWEFTGSEIPGVDFTMTRTVSVDDPSSLTSPMQYEVEVTEGLARTALLADRASDRMDTLLAYLREHPRTTQRSVVDDLGRWAEDLLKTARASGLAHFEPGSRGSKLWSAS
jgi:hypothetical protein